MHGKHEKNESAKRHNPFSVGQASSDEPAGTGTVTVSGAGSTLSAGGAHGAIIVGNTNASTGTLNVGSGGVTSAESLIVEKNPGSTGTMTVSGGSTATFAGNDGAVITNGNQVLNGGARVSVHMAGTGTLTLATSASMAINPTTPNGATGGEL